MKFYWHLASFENDQNRHKENLVPNSDEWPYPTVERRVLSQILSAMSCGGNKSNWCKYVCFKSTFYWSEIFEKLQSKQIWIKPLQLAWCKIRHLNIVHGVWHGLLWWLSGEESACNAGDTVSFPVGKIPWGRKWHPLQYSCLENPMDRGTWWAIVHKVTKESDTT